MTFALATGALVAATSAVAAEPPQPTVTPYRQVNVGGPALKVDGVAWLADNRTNVRHNGKLVKSPSLALRPATSASQAAMVRTTADNTKQLKLEVQGVAKGSYDVYLTTYEDNKTATFDLSVEGKKVVTKGSTGTAGAWKRHGPFRAAVADGALSVVTEKGALNVSGVEMFSLTTTPPPTTPPPTTPPPTTPPPTTPPPTTPPPTTPPPTTPPPTTPPPTTPPPTTTPPPSGAAVSVTSYGAKADDAVDDTAGIKAAFAAAAGAGKAVTFPAGLFRVNGTLDIPDALVDVRMATGTVLRQYGDPKFGTLSKRGSVVGSVSMSPAANGATTVKVASVGSLQVGSWVVLVSNDAFASHKPMNPGHLRRVTAVSGTTLTIDRPLNRALTTSPRAIQVKLTSTVSVTGGVLEHANKFANTYPALTLHYVQSPVISGTEIREHGASGVQPNGTVGGRFDVKVHDLLDDESGARFKSGRHYGYGVAPAGPVRDLVVTGECYRVRHCFTTNASYQTVDSTLQGYGDPEYIQVQMNVHDTTSSGLDTHEPGWNISFSGSTITNPGRYRAAGSTNGKEGGVGIFVRARGTKVENMTITGAPDDAITIARPAPGAPAWTRAEWPVVRNVKVLGTTASQSIAAHQPAVIGPNVSVTSTKAQFGLRIEAGAKGTLIDGVAINLGGISGGTGIYHSANATIGAVTYTGVVRPLSP